MLEDRSADSPIAVVLSWMIAVGFSALVVYYIPLDTFIEALFRPIGMVLLLVGIVAGAAQDAGVLTNERLREAASNYRLAFSALVIAIIIGFMASLTLSENAIVYVEIAVIGFVYASAVVRTVFVVSGAELG